MSFLPSKDGGRDGAFSGKWKKNSRDQWRGKFVFQCKFTSKSDVNFGLADLQEELDKVESLVKQRLCDIYILVTNAGVSGQVTKDIQVQLRNVGVKEVAVYGSTWLFEVIRESPRLRTLVPRIYGLGDLSQILDARVYEQGQALLESLKDDLAKVVMTKAYHQAAHALDKHGFVLLIGEPAAGKTTIASMLAMGALDRWKSFTMKLETASDVVDHWNPNESNQFFWVDDAFGVTQYERNMVDKWNHQISYIAIMIKKGAKVVLTSRDYIYRSARKDLKESAFPMFKENQVVVDVHDLSLLEKSQMLYNHLKLGTQPREFRQEIKPFLKGIASQKRFIPETARRLGSPSFTQNLPLWEHTLEDFVNKQEGLLLDVIGQLDPNSLAALALIYMNSDKLFSPVHLKQNEVEAIARMQSSLGGTTAALESMKGSLVQFVSGEEPFWKFKHPTIGDAFAVHVVESPELISIYLHGTPIEKLMGQVTCGNIGIEKAIVVQKNFFALLLDRLKTFKSTKRYKDPTWRVWGAKSQLHRFLATRCTKEFLTLYIKQHPDLPSEVSRPGQMLDAVSEVGVACRLHEFKLLPEEQRKAFVETISEYAISGEDLFGLYSKKIRSVFESDELEELEDRVFNELIPKISSMTEERKSNYTSFKEPEEFMRDLVETYDILEKVYSDKPETVTAIEKEKERIAVWVEENKVEEESIPERTLLASDDSDLPKGTEERSMFDDVDV